MNNFDRFSIENLSEFIIHPTNMLEIVYSGLYLDDVKQTLKIASYLWDINLKRLCLIFLKYNCQ